jgi:uncharacterized RDD family membrane protein YckC
VTLSTTTPWLSAEENLSLNLPRSLRIHRSRTKRRLWYAVCIMLTLRDLRLLFVAAFVALMIMAFASGPAEFGVSQVWASGQYYFAGGTSPVLLVFSALLIALYALLMRSEPSETENPVPGVVRRFFAFVLDFIFAILMFAPILGIAPTLFEWRRTGFFRWNFERTIQMSTDTLVTDVGLAIVSVLLAAYFVVPLKRGKPSPGACVFGYEVVSDDGKGLGIDTAVLRTLLGFVALSVWPIWAFIGRDKKNGKFWVDRIFNTRAVRLN